MSNQTVGNQTMSNRRAATRDRLIAAATSVFARRGVLGATVEEICDAAGFSRGAFYSNFETKDDLCVALLEAHTADYLAAARTAVGSMNTDAGRSSAEAIEAAIGVFTETLGEDPEAVLAMMELRLYAAREPALREAMAELDAHLTPVFSQVIGQALGAHGLKLSMPGEDAIGLLHAVWEHATLAQLIHPGGRAPNAEARLTTVLRAMVVPA